MAGTIDLKGGNNSLTLADGTNTLTVSNVETLTGGTGADHITLGALVTGMSVDLEGGNNSLVLANGTSMLTVTNVQTSYRRHG